MRKEFTCLIELHSDNKNNEAQSNEDRKSTWDKMFPKKWRGEKKKKTHDNK